MRCPILLIPPALLLLSACQPTPPANPTNPADFAFMGSWDCGVTVMTFLPDAYMPSNEDDPIAVTEFLRTANGATQITLANGNRMSVQSVTDQTMTWFSHQSGDSFDCTRVAG